MDRYPNLASTKGVWLGARPSALNGLRKSAGRLDCQESGGTTEQPRKSGLEHSRRCLAAFKLHSLKLWITCNSADVKHSTNGKTSFNASFSVSNRTLLLSFATMDSCSQVLKSRHGKPERRTPRRTIRRAPHYICQLWRRQGESATKTPAR
jgi:hypothetical protein